MRNKAKQPIVLYTRCLSSWIWWLLVCLSYRW